MKLVTKQTEGVSKETHAVERPYLSPPVNIFETKDAYLLEAEMPGVVKNGLEITLEGNVLTFVGRRADEVLPGATLCYRESKPADFRRMFEIDPEVDTGKIGAKMEQGVLTLTLPKAEKAKPRRIAVGE